MTKVTRRFVPKTARPQKIEPSSAETRPNASRQISPVMASMTAKAERNLMSMNKSKTGWIDAKALLDGERHPMPLS